MKLFQVSSNYGHSLSLGKLLEIKLIAPEEQQLTQEFH